MPDMATVPSATDSEDEKYGTAYRETRRVLDEAISHLSVLLYFEDDPDERFALTVDRRHLTEKRAKLVRAFVDYKAERAVMRPPRKALVNQIVDLSAKAVKITAADATASAIMEVATSALNKFSEIQTI